MGSGLCRVVGCAQRVGELDPAVETPALAVGVGDAAAHRARRGVEIERETNLLGSGHGGDIGCAWAACHQVATLRFGCGDPEILGAHPLDYRRPRA